MTSYYYYHLGTRTIGEKYNLLIHVSRTLRRVRDRCQPSHCGWLAKLRFPLFRKNVMMYLPAKRK